MISKIRSFSIHAYVRAQDLMSRALRSASTTVARHLGVSVVVGTAALATTPMSAQALGLTTIMDNWKTSINATIDFVMLGALLVGVLGIAYGAKLILDKSNDRENVKNSHIIVSFVGGSFLCILWVIITMLVETSGGNAGDMGHR